MRANPAPGTISGFGELSGEGVVTGGELGLAVGS
jgi:hypothetical protein